MLYEFKKNIIFFIKNEKYKGVDKQARHPTKWLFENLKQLKEITQLTSS